MSNVTDPNGRLADLARRVTIEVSEILDDRELETGSLGRKLALNLDIAARVIAATMDGYTEMPEAKHERLEAGAAPSGAADVLAGTDIISALGADDGAWASGGGAFVIVYIDPQDAEPVASYGPFPTAGEAEDAFDDIRDGDENPPEWARTVQLVGSPVAVSDA